MPRTKELVVVHDNQTKDNSLINAISRVCVYVHACVCVVGCWGGFRFSEVQIYSVERKIGRSLCFLGSAWKCYSVNHQKIHCIYTLCHVQVWTCLGDKSLSCLFPKIRIPKSCSADTCELFCTSTPTDPFQYSVFLYHVNWLYVGVGGKQLQSGEASV